MIQISDEKRYELLYHEWQCRHHTFWVSFNLWGSLVIAALGYGFVRDGFLERDWYVLALPLAGGVISLFAGYHLHAEASRMRLVGARISAYRDVARTGGEKVRSPSIAKVMANVFAIVLSSACVLSTWIQMDALQRNLGEAPPLRWCIALGSLVVLISLTWLYMGFARWRLTESEKQSEPSPEDAPL